MRHVILITLFLLGQLINVANALEDTEKSQNKEFGQRIAESPFVELYVLEELKQLRTEMAAQKNELTQKIVDREISSIDRGVEYATDAITYFFYMIAAASSVLVLVGWTSIRDIKERVHSVADQEITKLIDTYEQRLHTIEKQLNNKTQLIEENREEIALTQEIHSLWLRAGQDISPQNKISIYDQILKLTPEDTEAITYKADAVLELGEPQWAVNLCHQALAIDPHNSHAFYQLACAYTALNHFEQAVNYLSSALERSDSYKDELSKDKALEPLKGYEAFENLVGRKA
jgi:tetratricopeptide (TPR) repeat protein